MSTPPRKKKKNDDQGGDLEREGGIDEKTKKKKNKKKKKKKKKKVEVKGMAGGEHRWENVDIFISTAIGQRGRGANTAGVQKSLRKVNHKKG